MVFHNMMSCVGFADKGFLGGCSQAWLGLVIILAIAAIIRRQCDDGVLQGVSFFFPGALILGMGPAIILISIFGVAKWAILAGLVGMAVGGFGWGYLFGGDSG